MTYRFNSEPPAQFAFRIVEASGENVWYVGIVESTSAETIALEIEAAANELESDSAVAERVESPEKFEKILHAATGSIWIGFGFEEFDNAAWSKLDRNRTRLERKSLKGSSFDASVAVLVMNRDTYGDLQTNAPNLASWIGGSVFHLSPEAPLTDADREARLEELRRWASKTDDEVIRLALEKTLPADPYFAEWLVLLDRGDLLGND